MEVQPDDFGRPKALLSISTEGLRGNLSQAISRAAFGTEPVLIMRRGRNIAAIISISDFTFLAAMKQRRAETLAEKLPTDQSEIGAALARRLEKELFFG